MLKLGVVDRRNVRRPRTLLGRRRYISLLLLRDLAQDPQVSAEEYDRLAGHACMPNGVWKLTGHGRLSVLDATIADLLTHRHTQGASLVVCDLAASTGATSVDLFRTLRMRFDVRFIASDLYRDLVVVRNHRWPVAIVFDGSGREVQFVCGRFVLPAAPPESLAYPVNRALKALLRRRFVAPARALVQPRILARLGAFESIDAAGHEIVKLPMLTRNTLATIEERAGFTFEEWDIFARLPVRAHVVRAMNILTPEHFPDDQRSRAITNCVEALLPEGLFIVGSSPTAEPTDVRASIYSLGTGHLIRIASLNGGSEVDRIVANTYSVVEGTPCSPAANVRSAQGS